MYLSKFQLFNYKSFFNSGLLEFTPGINIIVGQNNVGKTALLEALTLNFHDIPHRSIKTLASNSSYIDPKSKANITLTFTQHEFYSLMNGLLLPVLILSPQSQNLNHALVNPQAGINLFKKWLETSNLVKLNLSLFSVNYHERIDVKNSELTFGLYEPQLTESNANRYPSINIKRTSEDIIDLYQQTSVPITDTIVGKLLNISYNLIYRFHAERFNVGSCAFGNNSELQPNASNLAEVLNSLQGKNPKRFERLNNLVSVIFPQIKRITVESRPQQVEIMVWNVDPETERQDLAISLSASGTGIGQVLAILYVVINSQEARTIIIDEPQSFLHPGAAKKLIEILKKDFIQHQYIIATHLPTIISAANPSKIVMLKYEDCETKGLEIDAKQTKEQRSLLAEVGVSLSDVFGADNILWVEGPTEERCFPLILENIAKKLLEGTSILAVKNTGDLDGKRAELIFDIYDKLSGGTSLFPPAIGFLFDSEGKSENKLLDLQKRSKRPVKFLPRRMYENYLLHTDAIVNIINEDDECREQPLTNEEVEEWLNKKKQEGMYLPKDIKIQKISDTEWSCKVDAANLLKDLFSTFCETRLVFSKTTHSFKLTQYLVDHNPDSLLEIANLLETIVSK
ncbi:chromosome segregation protein SMC [Nostoc sp. 'Peltigera membranacea cyanobiont' 210A]|uniref:ATP-dependent nuclease n=1 Tax=Nostoc sp. 'Peltigera membranacea cyanobiont' 210A TaxID=2014529 RepID=UPI000B952B66|nr:AAA family ATPase [Nostoc sp. 'Peltigera membranacea cyanobiont' 210A]OYD90238.1 chromosome segregation protein SMC [Nostoc sp. 'Peltigera membranacea cyanobiont' 210A]